MAGPSPGQGQWAKVPWVGIFDPIVTSSATRGHYVVYLFSSDMNRLFLSLNQGTTAAHEEFGSKANSELSRRAELLRHRVPEFRDHFNADEIELKATGLLPTGYEAGHAFGTSYRLDELTFTDEMEADLSRMIELYFKSSARGGTDFFGEGDTDDNANQTDLFERRRYRYHRRIERNAALAKRAKAIHGYICQACGFEFEQIYGEIGREYIEAHHLTPLSELPEGKEVKTDPKDDFAVLCANCHRMIHRKEAPKSIRKFKDQLNQPC